MERVKDVPAGEEGGKTYQFKAIFQMYVRADLA